jgi:hypothetical protein
MLRTTGAVLAVALLGAGCAATTTTSDTPRTTTTIPSASGQQVVISQPTPSAAVRGEVRHNVSGRVTDIDREDSSVTVRTPDGSRVKLRLPPVAVATVREGDMVSMDVLISPR